MKEEFKYIWKTHWLSIFFALIFVFWFIFNGFIMFAVLLMLFLAQLLIYSLNNGYYNI